MTAINASVLSDQDLSLTGPAQEKMNELVGQVEENIEGVRVFASPGGCSGINFGMTFTDQLTDDDSIREFGGFKVIVDSATLAHMRGVEIDFISSDGGDARFVFNNLPQMAGGGCGTCGSSQGGGCG